MSEEQNTHVYIVVPEKKGEPGGFTMRNLGPDKVLLTPGIENAVPKEWIDAGTIATLVRDKHMKFCTVDGAVEAEMPKVPEAPEIVAKVETNDLLKELCTFKEAELKDKSRAELDELLAQIYEAAEIKDVPRFDNKKQVIEFLTGAKA